MPADGFVDAFVSMVEELLSEQGADGYRRHWGHPFPAEEWDGLPQACAAR
ncbi:hypothetical protein [Streptomyces sp. NPDC002640]